MKKKILIGFAVVIVVLIILGAIGSKSSNSSSATATVTSANQAAQKVAKIGDTVTDDNNIAFTVTGLTTAQTLGNSFTQKTAQGQYYVVSVKVLNNGKSTQTINSSDFKLTDGQGRSFDPSTDGMMAKSEAEGKTDFFLQQVQPGLSVTGDLVFDAPANDTGLKLQVQGNLFSNGQTIDLGK